MKITNKKTGHSFNISGKGAADFFYSKNAKGKFINTSEDYNIEDTDRKISNVKFYIVCIGLVVISVSSLLFHLHLNY